METPDELGVLADYRRVALVEQLYNILWEIIANRKWNLDKKLVKFLFIRFKDYFILGTTQFRTKESIEKEHTPFKFNKSQADTTASVSARGYGAKLFPFNIQGQYSNLFRLTDTDTFSSDPSAWGMKDWIDITELGKIIDNNDEFETQYFRSIYHTPMTKKNKGETVELPFFLKDDFLNSDVNTFIQLHNLKYFYVFKNSPSVSAQLDSALEQIARVYQKTDVEIYSSTNLSAPVLIETPVGFGIHTDDWSGAMALDWVIGEKKILNSTTGTRTFYKSEVRVNITGSDKNIWSRNDSNSSSDKKFGYRFTDFKPLSEEIWKPKIRITIALMNDAYMNTLSSNDTKIQENIYIRMEDDLISFPSADPTIASKLRNTPLPSRLRIIVDILEESVKTNPEAGLAITGVKSKSNIIHGKAIHECIIRSLDLFKKHITRVIQNNDFTFCSDELLKKLEEDCNPNKEKNKKSAKRSKEALLFESRVSKYLETELSSVNIGEEDYTITWEDNDATISANHNLEGQAIDTLGRLATKNNTIWIAIQSKDRESAIPKCELDNFINTLNSLRVNKDVNDKIIPILTLAKMKSFNYDTHIMMLKAGIFTVVETVSDSIGSVSEAIILQQFSTIL